MIMVLIKPFSSFLPFISSTYSYSSLHVFTDDMPDIDTSQKNLAVLAALSAGADVIVVLEDCLQASLSAVISALEFAAGEGEEHGLMHNDTRLFNPYPHFGAWAALPRTMLQDQSHENITSDSTSRQFYIH